MASKTEPRSGVYYGWTLGESGWNEQMDANLKRIGRIGFHLSVKDRGLNTPPASPADGDSYIVATGGIGAWAGHDGKVAVWDNNLAAWVIYAPRIGWTAYIENEDKFCAYKSTGWSVGITL